MRIFTSALAIGLTLGLSPLALADGGCPGACPAGDQVQGPPAQLIDDDEDEAALLEIEKQLDDILLVDEGGQIVLRDEFRAMLPEDVPVDRVQMMLGALVELDPEGNFVFKNREMMRPYLPMLRNFLEQGGLERLRGLKDMSPEQREKALRDMMEEQNGGDAPFGRGPAPAPRDEPRARPDRASPDRAQRDGDNSRRGRLEQRLQQFEERMEQRMGRLEELLRGRRSGGDGFEQGGEGRRGLGRLGDAGRRMRVWSNGLRKLGELMTPEDVEQLRKIVQNMKLGPQDLQDRDGLMEKLQNGLEPQDMARLMEIFATFIATPEGREFVEEVENTVTRLEAFVNSPEGQRLGDALQQLQGRLNNGEGGNDIMKRLQDMIQGRDRGGADKDQNDEHRRARPRRHDGEQGSNREHSDKINPPAGSKLY